MERKLSEREELVVDRYIQNFGNDSRFVVAREDKIGLFFDDAEMPSKDAVDKAIREITSTATWKMLTK